jgi:hypothetical protein
VKLEGVTCCVDYADFLAETLPHNRVHFDRLIVVTAPEDKETQRVCRYYGVPFALTDVFRTRWGEMHKARGINVGLRQLALDGWVCHLDADIVLPPKTRELIDRADLDRSCLYGVDRFMVRSHADWRRHQALPALQQDDYYVRLGVFELGARFSGERMGGWAPPGFFQLWCPRWSNVRSYPEDHATAARTDVQFAAQWWRSKRALLPEFVVYHLEPEPGTQGANWGGRVTPRFGAVPDRSSPFHPANHRRPPDHRELPGYST